jgi:hypothetical protein
MAARAIVAVRADAASVGVALFTMSDSPEGASSE